jgi:hypothetical protein
LAGAVKGLAEALKSGSERSRPLRDAIVLAHWEAQSYKSDEYTDLYDFCDLLQERCAEEPLIAEGCQRVKDIIDEQIVVRSLYCGPAFQYSYGLSIYFPWAQVAARYKETEFAQDTGWGDFLEDLRRKDAARSAPTEQTHRQEGG